MAINYFRPRRPGPELMIEDAVVEQVGSLFGEPASQWWLGGSVSIGSGRPDFVAVQYERRLVSLAHVETNGILLAYLRSVREARLDTIADRVGQPRRAVERELSALCEIQAVWERDDRVFALAPTWRGVLSGIITIEAKIADWKRAIQQAARNGIFANESYVALPKNVVERVASSPMFDKLGIGIISVNEDGLAEINRKANWHPTRVWAYYFQLAALVAQESGKRACHTLSPSTRPDASFLTSHL